MKLFFILVYFQMSHIKQIVMNTKIDYNALKNLMRTYVDAILDSNESRNLFTTNQKTQYTLT